MTFPASGIGLVIGIALIAGCGNSPKQHYYTLSAPAVPAEEKPGFTVAVGPVTVPEMVDRAQIVVRTSVHQVEVSELNRWAEPLKRSIPQVVAASLARELAPARVVVYSPGGGSADYRVRIDVERFESEPGKAATIAASWSVRRNAGGEARAGRSMVRESADGSGYETLVAAHSRALEGVSRDIADALRAMNP